MKLIQPTFKIGDKVLITTDNWFITPSGENYRAVFGTVHNILTDELALGIRTNARSTNWYIEVGNMLIAGCQIHYAIRTDSINNDPFPSWKDTAEGIAHFEKPSTIYNADSEYKPNLAALDSDQ